MERSSSQESVEADHHENHDARDASESSEPAPVQVQFEKTSLKGSVGFDSITKQIESRSLKKGFDLNILVTGQAGLGKTTFINTLFQAHLVDSKYSKSPSEQPRKTTTISTRSHLIEEKGVKLKLTVIDTPGFAEQLDNNKSWEPIVTYIQEQYHHYQKEESSISRKKVIPDTRVHVCLYFIAPNGHSLKPVDIETMKNLGEVVNLVPVIGKSDSLTVEERQDFKKRINEEIKFHKIRIYPSDYSDYDAEGVAANKIVTDLIPFAVIGSEKTVTVDGKSVPGRQLAWGTINVEDRAHSDFPHIRDFLMKTHLQDLIDTTKYVHYEAYRAMSLQNKKEKKKRENSTRKKD